MKLKSSLIIFCEIIEIKKIFAFSVRSKKFSIIVMDSNSFCDENDVLIK